MQRLLSTALVLGLLVATAAAFAITEGLKLVPSPIRGTQVQKTFSPVCACPKRLAEIEFRLRRADTLTLDILDAGRHRVRRLADAINAPRGTNRFTWDGRTDGGAVAPSGAYVVRVHLAAQHRTILLPNRIALDTVPPRVVAAETSRSVISPDSDGQLDSVRISYRLSEPAHATVFLDGTRILRTKTHQPRAVLTWYGTRDGKPLPAGTYRLRIGAEDVAGNVSTRAGERVRVVRIRYIELLRHRIVVPAGVRFGVRVDTDAKRYGWRLGSRRGVGTSVQLVLRSPKRPGRYTLTVFERGHRDAAVVRVRARP